MKKLLLTIITLSIITFTGCYDPDTATVRINLGNMPVAHHEPKSFIDRILGLFEKEAWAVPAGVIKVHIAAYSDRTPLITESIDAADITTIGAAAPYDYIELDIPVGDNITILVIGEDSSNIATYFGSTTTDLKAGESKEVSVSPQDSTYWSGVEAIQKSGQIITWTGIGVKATYHVYSGFAGTTMVWRTIPFYIGYDTTTSYLSTDTYFRYYIEFEEFDVRTNYIN